MAKKRHHDGMMKSREMEKHEYYAGEKSRRHEEMRDAGMIHEDHSAIANLPQNVMMKEYPKPGGYMPEDIDDTIRGVDGQMEMDNRQRMKTFSPKKV